MNLQSNNFVFWSRSNNKMLKRKYLFIINDMLLFRSLNSIGHVLTVLARNDKDTARLHNIVILHIKCKFYFYQEYFTKISVILHKYAFYFYNSCCRKFELQNAKQIEFMAISFHPAKCSFQLMEFAKVNVKQDFNEPVFKWFCQQKEI